MKYLIIRKTIHFFFGIGAIASIYLLPNIAPYLFLCVASGFLTFDLWRKKEGKWRETFYRILGRLLKTSESEGQITGATTFVISIAALSSVFARDVVVAAILILSISDPLASIVGKYHPVKGIWKEKSVSGTLTFFISSLMIYQFLAGYSGLVLLPAALVVTLIELFAPEILENILIAFVSAIILTFIS